MSRSTKYFARNPIKLPHTPLNSRVLAPFSPAAIFCPSRKTNRISCYVLLKPALRLSLPLPRKKTARESRSLLLRGMAYKEPSQRERKREKGVERKEEPRLYTFYTRKSKNVVIETPDRGQYPNGRSRKANLPSHSSITPAQSQLRSRPVPFPE